MEETLTLTTENWEKEVINSDIPVVVDFWAEWCMPCKIVEPHFKALAKKYKGKIKFGRLNVDEEVDISQKYEIMAIPTFILFKGGKEIDRLIGAAPKDKLEEFIKKVLQ